MHELSIAQGILEVVRDHVPPERCAEVTSVRLRVGKLAGVVVDSLCFCYEALVRGTALAASQLDVEVLPLQMACGPCGRTHEVEEWAPCCPVCGGSEIRAVSGRELDVVEIELGEQHAEAS